jgi:predicted nucleic acid-binding protein
MTSEIIVPDSTVWIDFFRGLVTPQTGIILTMLPSPNIITGDLIIAETLQGFREDVNFDKAKRHLRSLAYHTLVGKRLAYKAASNYRFLRKKGITIRKTIDMLIATFCIEYGYALLHHDRDFDSIEEHLGLKVVRG